MDKRKKIIISGYYGFGNLGDEAILISIIDRLNAEIENPEIVVLYTKAESEQLKVYKNVRCVYRMNPISIFFEMLNADLVISGGGGLLQDSTGFTTVLYYLGIVKMALFLKKKVLFYAQGIGPLNLDKSKKLITNTVNKVNFITVRDNDSAELLKSLKIDKAPVVVTADPVISMEKLPQNEIDELVKKYIPNFKKNNNPNIGISARPWKSDNNYIEILAKSCDELIKKYNANIYIIPFQIQQDLAICKEIKEKMEGEAEIIMPPNSEDSIFQFSPKEIAGIIGQMDLIIAMRLHALIFSFPFKIPSAGIVYDPKVGIFAKQAGMESFNLDSFKKEDVIGFVGNNLNKNYSNDSFDKLYNQSILTGKIASDMLSNISAEEIIKKRGLILYDRIS